MRKTPLALLLALASATAAGTALAVAAAGPDGPGQIYDYYDDTGQHVGHFAIDCYGNIDKWGHGTSHYEVGYYICDPDPR